MIGRDELVAGYTCPRCSAPKGEPCRGRRGPRASAHIQRWNAAGISQADLSAAAYARLGR